MASGSRLRRRWLHSSHAEDVVVRDFGIRGFDLAYALLEPWEAVILVDALPRGGLRDRCMRSSQGWMGDGSSAEGDESAWHGPGAGAASGRIDGNDHRRGYSSWAASREDFGDELEGRMGLSAAFEAAVAAGLHDGARSGRAPACDCAAWDANKISLQLQMRKR